MPSPWAYAQVKENDTLLIAELNSAHRDSTFRIKTGTLLTAYPFIFDSTRVSGIISIGVNPGPTQETVADSNKIWVIG
jgi:hypothetical protein